MKEIMGWLKAILIAFAAVTAVSMFLIQPYTVNGLSMEPTFDGLDESLPDQKGDRVLVYKTSYMLGKKPKSGDIVIIDSNVDEERTLKDEWMESPIVSLLNLSDTEHDNNWIKRVVGEAGDTMEVKSGSLYKNGEKVEEPYINEPMESDFAPYTVPEGTVFVMGDNRNHSSDSREIGPVPLDHVVGKIVLRFYPFNRMDAF